MIGKTCVATLSRRVRSRSITRRIWTFELRSTPESGRPASRFRPRRSWLPSTAAASSPSAAPWTNSFAKEPPLVRDLAQPLGFTDEMRPLGRQPYSLVVTARTEPATPAVGASLHLGLRASVHYLERVRGADGVPYLLEQAYLPAERFPGLLDEDFTTVSLYEALERRYACRVTLTRETIAACIPSTREARLLKMPQPTASLRLEGIAFASEEPVEFSRTIVSGETARYAVETVGGRSRLAEPIADSEAGPGPETNRR
jgi:hypothetical protein